MRVDDVRAAWQRLHVDHALVLDSDTGEIRMANPFSGVPTPFLVHTDVQTWYANCAWDAFGICAALDVDGHIETVCPDCGGPSAGLVRCQACRDDHGTVKALLRKLGVLGNKHIPTRYLRGSVAQRKALLAGLLDTDGTVAPNGVMAKCPSKYEAQTPGTPGS